MSAKPSHPTHLARALRLYRVSRGLSLRELAAEIGMLSSATLFRIEEGRAMDLASWQVLVNWLLTSSEATR